MLKHLDLRLAKQFHDNRDGLSAIEFALVLPILLSIFIGVTEVGQAISVSRKVTITTRTITDLVTQNTSLSNAQLTTLLQASAETIAPYASGNLSITVSEISVNAAGVATVTWSDSYPTASNALQAGSTFQLPTSLNVANTTLIYGLASYAYTPTFGYNIIGTTALADHIYLSPRNSTTITYTD